jgi:hypothetical protein
MSARLLLIAGLTAVLPSPARAICYYNGKFSATTTIEQEFRDARWVVRARVLSAHYHWSVGAGWTSYRLRVVRGYKGRMPATFIFFTTRDSGGFYMDKGMGTPDRSQDYLLFLVPYPRNSDHPAESRGAYWVNYNCGKSQPWPQLTNRKIHRLDVLADHRR